MRTESTYSELSSFVAQECQPTAVANPQWLAFNAELAEQLGLPQDYWLTDTGLGLFSGNQLPEWAKPVALAYSGHQFGHFNPTLGDGRALLLTEVVTPSGERYDMQLKGSGQTPYSRSGDGRSPIGPVLREYIVSEAMHAYGIPTSRALAAVATGELVYREDALPGAILTRVASSHLRIGTVEYIARLGQPELLKAFMDYVIERHYPECKSAQNPYLVLYSNIIEAQAKLVAQWMSIGFIHGVMNTDNMTLSGETIDYGPCAFMEAYDPATVFSFIDKRGRYAYQNQPKIAQWNLARLGEAMITLFANEQEQAIKVATLTLEQFQGIYSKYYWQFMSEKIGLPGDTEDDRELVHEFLTLLKAQQIDFTLGFRYICDNDDSRISELLHDQKPWQRWQNKWHQRMQELTLDISAEKLKMKDKNPAYIPRNHQVEAAIQEAMNSGSLARFNRLNEALKSPFTEQETFHDLLQPAASDEQVTRTFCGT